MCKRLIFLLGTLAAGLFFSASAHAECGGLQECIGISSDPTVAPAHSTDGVNRPAPTLDFGNQAAGGSSAARTILVAATEGPAGTRAMLNSITLTGANATDFTITGGTCTVGTPTLLHDGAVTAQIANACTITVKFNPAAVGIKTAQVNVTTASITRVAPLTGTGTPSLTGPTAAAATLTAQVNTATTLNLAPFITGTVTGVAIVTAPAHGVVTANGTSVTYTPTRDYFGADTFSYAAFNAVGSSTAAVVTVNVTGRPDPSKDARVIGLVGAQAQTVRRFSRAQISNFQQRMESLHRGAGVAETGASGLAEFGPKRGPASNGGSGPVTSRAALARAGIGANSVGDPIDITGDLQSRNNPLVRIANEPGLRRPGAADSASDLLPVSLASALFSGVTTRSVNILNASSRSDGSTGLPGGTSIWSGGDLKFGTHEATSDTSSRRFSTSGVSIGLDHQLSTRFTLGLGVGYARDTTDIGADGSKIRSSGSSIAVYGSYLPAPKIFVDGLLGYGVLSHDMDRFVPAANDFARSNRRSDQLFGSLAAGFEHRGDGLLLSPYGRLDFSLDRLKQATETGAGLNALTYFDQNLPTLQFSLGLRAESMHETRFGWALPRLRVELAHDFQGSRDATIAFADQFVGPRYSVTTPGVNRNSLLVGIGSDFLFPGGLKLGIDYQTLRSIGPDTSQAIRLWISKDLDGKPLPLGLLSPKGFADPVRVEAGYTWDNNVTRASDAIDKLSDSIYNLNVSKGMIFSLADHTRAVVTGSLSGDKLYRYTGLDRFSGGVNGELQYRTSGEFGAPTFGVFGRGSYDDYASRLRSGYRHSYGVSVRKPLTDRIDAFVALASNGRNAENAVFGTKDRSARINLDYSMGRHGVVYLGGEYRRGDTVSTGAFSAQSVAYAKVFTPDDAYGNNALFAYRLEAKTVLWTLGYNVPLGPKDSIDFSWRRAQSTPTAQPAPGNYLATSQPSYTANLYSLAYLMRF